MANSAKRDAMIDISADMDYNPRYKGWSLYNLNGRTWSEVWDVTSSQLWIDSASNYLNRELGLHSINKQDNAKNLGR